MSKLSELRKEVKLFYSNCCQSKFLTKSNGLYCYYVCCACNNKTIAVNGKGKMLDLHGLIKPISIIQKEDNKKDSNPTQPKRVQIHISEIWKMVERQAEINRADLNDVDFLDENNVPIKVDPKIINDFRLCGLNNLDFITSGFYEEGFGDGK